MANVKIQAPTFGAGEQVSLGGQGLTDIPSTR